MKKLRLLLWGFLGSSNLDDIVQQGFVSINEPVEDNDYEIYGKGEERILYNGRTDEIVKRYFIEHKV